MYTFTNTERTNARASEYETKSLLYLIGQRKDKREISIIAIDCFNDVTGLNEHGNKLWDIQSKGEARLTPRKIGRYLITLFKNYQEDFSFFEYIFFMPKIDGRYINDSVQGIYKISNFKNEQAARIREGLVKEIFRIEMDCDEDIVDMFLEKVNFVEDRKKISTYVKDVVRFKHQGEKENKFYEEIFIEIRNIQSAKKNSYIEGEVVSKPIDVLKLDRHIVVDDLKMLVVNRFVGVDLFNQKMIPYSFMDVVKNYESQDIQDVILDCKSQIGRAFFDKNQKREFWIVFEHIVSSVNGNPNVKVGEILESLNKKVLCRLSHLNDIGIMFLAALIKDGLNEN